MTHPVGEMRRTYVIIIIVVVVIVIMRGSESEGERVGGATGDERMIFKLIFKPLVGQPIHLWDSLFHTLERNIGAKRETRK